jgi:hypothetical protein
MWGFHLQAGVISITLGGIDRKWGLQVAGLTSVSDCGAWINNART